MVIPDNIVIENEKRNALLFSPYDPEWGIGSPIQRFPLPVTKNMTLYLPESMKEDALVASILLAGSVEDAVGGKDGSLTLSYILEEINQKRLDHDFEYWCSVCIEIQDKETLEEKPFILRPAQRKLIKIYEEDRLSGHPIRVIVDKARQWGGSTCTQIYMMWIQQRHKFNWHLAVCAHLDDAAKNIRGMYSHAASRYPADFGTITLLPYEKSTKNQICKERGCIIGVGSVENPDQFRSYNYAMIHMSEVALYGQTTKKNANKLIQSLRSTVPTVPYSMIVLESTAMGTGNLFHKEWMAAIGGRSAYKPVFIPWFTIEMYWKPIKNYNAFWEKINNHTNREYLLSLWELGASLESINWYISFKEGENYSDLQMFQEFPSTWQESFTVSGRRVFSPLYTQDARKSCTDPLLVGQLFGDATKGKEAFSNLHFQSLTNGELAIWAEPDLDWKGKNRYVVIVDIGGKNKDADWSTARVMDRYWMMDGGSPEAVASWKGHMDQDLFAWVAAQLAWWYHQAELIVESNSLDSEEMENTEGDQFMTILDEIADYYPNLYTRTHPDKIREGIPAQYGFHTNRQTKPMVINALIAAWRDRAYIERDARVMDEADQFEHKPNGKMGAVDGAHDDLIIPTAIGVWACYSALDPVEEIKEREKPKRRVRRTEATL